MIPIEELKKIIQDVEKAGGFWSDDYKMLFGLTKAAMGHIEELEIKLAQAEEISEESKLPVFQITKDEYGLHASSIPADESLEARTEAAMHCAMMIREASK